MSSSGNVWAVNRIQHICNTGTHKSPIYGLFRLSKHSQRDNYLAREIQFKEITNLRTSVLGFFLTKSEKIYYSKFNVN